MGVAVDAVDRYVELGVLKPAEGDRFSAGDVRRITVLETMTQAGMPLDGIGEAMVRPQAHWPAQLDCPLVAAIRGIQHTSGGLAGDRGALPSVTYGVREAAGDLPGYGPMTVSARAAHVVPPCYGSARRACGCVSLATTEAPPSGR